MTHCHDAIGWYAGGDRHCHLILPRQMALEFEVEGQKRERLDIDEAD